MRTSSLAAACLTLTSLLVACGGAQPEAAAPGGTETTVTAPNRGGEKEEAPDAEKEGAPEAEAEKAAEPEEAATTAPARSAKDIITRADVLFMPSFSASEPYQKAEKACAEKAKGDPKKKADCLAKARDAMPSEGIAFQRDADGTYYWLTLGRKGGGLVTLHKIAIEFGEDSDKQITLKPKGPDKGTKRMGNIPRELVIEISGDSEIALTDPKHGRLVYEVKLGLLGEQQR